MKFIEKDFKTFKIIDLLDPEPIGSVEIIEEIGYNFIENIFLEKMYRNRGYLRKIIDYLKTSKPLVCLPLPEHLNKFKHLGFQEYERTGEDVYYILR